LTGPLHGRAIRRDAHPPGHGQGFWQAGRLGGCRGGRRAAGAGRARFYLDFLRALWSRPPRGLDTTSTWPPRPGCAL